VVTIAKAAASWPGPVVRVSFNGGLDSDQELDLEKFLWKDSQIIS
jgi:hypothetical protein